MENNNTVISACESIRSAAATSSYMHGWTKPEISKCESRAKEHIGKLNFHQSAEDRAKEGRLVLAEISDIVDKCKEIVTSITLDLQPQYNCVECVVESLACEIDDSDIFDIRHAELQHSFQSFMWKINAYLIAMYFRKLYEDYVCRLTGYANKAILDYVDKYPCSWSEAWAREKNLVSTAQLEWTAPLEEMRRAVLNSFLYRIVDSCDKNIDLLRTVCERIGMQRLVTIAQWAVRLDRANALYHMRPDFGDMSVVGLAWIRKEDFANRSGTPLEGDKQPFATINKRLVLLCEVGVVDAALLETTYPERLLRVVDVD